MSLQIIVVDENAQDGLQLCEQLRNLGHLTRYVESGIKAINAVSMYGGDLLLIHHHMAVLTGIDTVQLLLKLQRRGPKVEIIGLIDTADPALEAECLEAGMHAVFTKPLDVKQLEATLGTLAVRPRHLAKQSA